ncbi:MAG TPA: hypothetical protein DCZ94_16715 [Lentisphaeria bacterium]|nr:MAG: hypothetical protein A2X48_16815 [Lentisphaerae bacterium GWF2_49_21]HBC88591.1 hypothetical protein [Lentisphaeria bacterium]
MSNKTRGKIIVNLILLLLLLGGIGVCFYFLKYAGDISPAKRYGLRIGIVVLALIAWFRSQSMISGRECKSGLIADLIHDVSAGANAYLKAHPKAANALLITSSMFIDMFGIFLILASVFGPSMRPFVALLILFMMRQICQALCALPIPPEMIWRSPGVPSLLVTYGVANDFFFSGHTSIAMLGAIEVFRMCPLWLGIIAAVVAVFEMVTVLILRAHYTMDVFTAVVAAFCATWLAGLLCAVL